MRSVGLRRSAHGLENRFVAISQRQADWMIREVVPFSLGRAPASHAANALFGSPRISLSAEAPL